jgi:hypothetical protein
LLESCNEYCWNGENDSQNYGIIAFLGLLSCPYMLRAGLEGMLQKHRYIIKLTPMFEKAMHGSVMLERRCQSLG